MSLPTLETRVDGLFAGRVETRWDGKAPSAIGKIAVHSAVDVTETGLAVDAQADLAVHGGPEKALHHYPGDHYPAWVAEGRMAAGTEPAAFGENITTVGATERDVCIGDVFRLGTALVQISQGRQPCWKLNAHTGRNDMAAAFQKTGRTGWYYRVLETGRLGRGDTMRLIERPCPEWSVFRVTRARLTKRIDAADAAILAALPELAEGWRGAFARMAQGLRAEDTSSRLIG